MFSAGRSLSASFVFAAIVLVVGGACTPSSERSAAPVPDSAIVDSMRTTLERVNEGERRSASDSAQLRQWAGRMLSTADSLVDAHPDSARHLFLQVRRSARLLGDSVRLAKSLDGLGRVYTAEALYDSARASHRTGLAIARQLQLRREVADHLRGLSYVLQHQGKYAESLERYRKALRLYREMGHRRQVADVRSDIGVVYAKTGRFDNAAQQWTQALPIRRELGDERGTAQILGNLGILYKNQGRYEKAIEHYEDALAVQRENGWTEDIAITLTNMGNVYQRLDQYETALEHLREGLSYHRDHGNQTHVASTLNNIGILYRREGRYSKALDRYREALSIKRELGDRHGVAHTLNNIGVVYKHRGAYDEALEQYRASVSILSELGDRESLSEGLNNLGTIHRIQGRFKQAHRFHQKALIIKQEIGDRDGIAETYADLGDLYRREGDLGEALKAYNRALRLNRDMGRTAPRAAILTERGHIWLEQGQPVRAQESLTEAVRLVEEMRRKTTSPESRRSLLATQIETYRALTVANIRRGRPHAAVQATERARARLLAERLAGTARGDTTLTVPSTATLQEGLAPEEAAVLYTNSGSGLPLFAMVVTPDSVRTRRLPDDAFGRQLQRSYAGALDSLRRRDGPLVQALGPSSARIDSAGVAEAVRLYRHQLTQVEGRDSVQTGLSRMLHRLLVAPVEPMIEDVRTLTVVPTGAVSYLPLEALQGTDGTYLIEHADVRYGQSLTVLRQLRQHPERSYERPLLAFGGAEYAASPQRSEQAIVAESNRSIITDEHAMALHRSVERRIDQGRSLRPTYDQLGFGRWAPLFGTKLEVQKLGRIAGGNATVYTDREVSEEAVRRLSRTGELREFRRIHFATHGVAVPEAPQLSGLVLSQVGVSDSLADRDGFLTMREIAELDLRTDVAVLSACRTGLGRMIAGEGVVNLSHAFLRAGANATLVSQWRVLDWSTQQFMASVYREATTGGTFLEAVSEVKRSFLAGRFGERNVDPMRWAPFVFYGRMEAR